MFSKQEQQIKVVAAHEKTLCNLLEKLSASCFDADDKQIVLDKLNQIQELKISLEMTLAKNKEIYKTQVQGVEKNLRERQSYLEQVDNVFQEFPELLIYFTNKQKTLEESLIAVTNQLQQ